MADVWANSMACHPRATCHIAGCCPVASQPIDEGGPLSRDLRDAMLGVPIFVNIFLLAHFRQNYNIIGKFGFYLIATPIFPGACINYDSLIIFIILYVLITRNLAVLGYWSCK